MSSSFLTPTSNETGPNKGKNANRRLSLANIVDELNSKRDKRIDTRYSYRPSNNRKSLATCSNASKTDSSNGSSQPSFMSSIIDIGPLSQPDFLSSKIPINKKDLDMRKSSLSSSKWSFDNLKENHVSVINRIGEAVAESENLFDFLRRAFSLLYYTKLTTLIMFLLAIYHLVMIFFGLKNLENCPKEPKIPIYLFVCGCVGLLKSLHMIWFQMQNSASENDDYSYRTNSVDGISSVNTTDETTLNKSPYFTDIVLNLFLLVWLAFGNYWIFSIYMPNYEPMLYEPNNFCAKKLYVFSLVQLFVYYSIIAFLILLTCVLTCFTQIPFLITKFQEF